MKRFIKKIYLILFLSTILSFSTVAFAKSNKIDLFQENISNYFSGIISFNKDYTSSAFKYLDKVQFLRNDHSDYNIKFIRTLVLLEKYKQAFAFSKDIWSEDRLLFEADLLLGLDSFINKDYLKATKHFERLTKVPQYNLLFGDFLGNILLAWTKASENNKKDSLNFLNKIPGRYHNLKKIQNAFLQCYFDTSETKIAFEQLTKDEDHLFSRYNFFLANYLLFKNKNEEARKIILQSTKKHSSNLLLKQAESFILAGKNGKIKNFFDCKNPNDVISETFYIMSNLYSTQEDYQLSNFYLKISLLLNKKFTPNKTLLAENFYYQERYELSKKTYDVLKSIGPNYSWYASKHIAIILSDTKGLKYSTSYLEKEFKLLPNHNFQHYYELANFYKNKEYYEESIKYYSLALENIDQNHKLVPKILDRRGTSYERIGDWNSAERDLTESIEILPDQPHVLNYLAYSWVEKKINMDKALEMLKKAVILKENDGYIIDSLGWAYYAKKNYIAAEKFLQRAVELKPLDPIINDHYADVLWMVNKNIQARYFWKYVLSLEDAEKKLKDNINKKLVFGITKNL